MGRIIKRLLQLIFILFALAVACFIITHFNFAIFEALNF